MVPRLPDSCPRRRLAAADVARMVAAGILEEDEPLELIDGELIVLSPQGPRHRGLVVRFRQMLEEAFGPAFHVQDRSPIDAGGDSLPEPDVAVVRGSVRAFMDRHPAGSDVALVVEISVTSQELDRAKAAIYAACGVAEYWNVDVPAGRIDVYRDAKPARASYATRMALAAEDTVTVAGVPIAVAKLLR